MSIEPGTNNVPSFFTAETQLWIHYGGKHCIVCKHVYEDGKDMVERDVVRATPPPRFEIACNECFELAKHS